MDRVRTETFRGKRLLIVDGTGVGADEYAELLRAGARAVVREPAGSVRLATVVTGARYGRGASEHIKAYSSTIGPFLKASAVVGLSPLMRVIFWGVKPFMHSTVTAFETLDEARAWLAGFGE